MICAVQSSPACAGTVTTPREALGRDLGEDYFLASYSQLEAYWKTLAKQSDRARLVEIGRTSEGRPQYMMVVSSAANIRALDAIRAVAERLARAKDLTEAQARDLARSGKAVVWIDGGMHANETVPAQALMLAVYRALSDNDPEWTRILDDVVILFGAVNPDGQEMVADWYMRTAEPEKRQIGMTPDGFPPAGVTPFLWQKYAGHDNNRDYYMANLPETENVDRVLFRQWFPQIVYNQHQPGPAGAAVFIPPFGDPFNYNFDPLTMTQVGEVGNAMQSRLVEEGKPGGGMQDIAPYSTWYNGSLRTTSYFHNMVGILTEITGNPTPVNVHLVARNQLPRLNLPAPVAPQLWHIRQSLDYTLSMDRAVLDYASRNRERLLFNIYRMGANSIARGSTDSWTVTPSRIAALEAADKLSPADTHRDLRFMPGGAITTDAALYEKILRDPAYRDARGYIVPADQPDFPTAVKFLNALIKTGVEVERATSAFEVAGKSYPAGSFVVRTAQAFRPQILDMFEAQDHPTTFAYPGGPPVKPYDSAGYTLAFQMGVKFDRFTEGFDGPFAPVDDLLTPPVGAVVGSAKAGYVLDHRTNDSVILVNRLTKAGLPVSWLRQPLTVDGGVLSAGAIWVPRSPRATAILARGAAELGLIVHGQDKIPAGPRLPLEAPRIALVDVYGGSSGSGWTRFLFDQFEFPYTVVYPAELDAGNLRAKYDVVVLPSGVGAGALGQTGAGAFHFLMDQPRAEEIPARYHAMLGSITAARTGPALEAFARQGGTVIASAESTAVGAALGLPLSNPLTETVDGKTSALSPVKFQVRGSLITARVDPSEPLAYGMGETADLFFDSSPVFRIDPAAKDVHAVAWFSGSKVLKSGWAWGQERLDGASAIVDAPLGKGRVLLMGPEVGQRGQSHGTFKFLFNGVYYGPAVSGARH